MAERRPSRREYLAAVSAAGATGIAGCQWGSSTDERTEQERDRRESDVDSFDDSDVLPEFPKLTAAEPTYRKWLPADADSHLPFPVMIQFELYREARPTVSPSTYEQSVSWAMAGDYFGVGFDELTGAIASLADPSTIIFPGSFDLDIVTRTLEDTGYELTESRSGVSFYRRSNGTQRTRIAVGPEGVVQELGGNAENFADEVAVLYETARGERERRHEGSESFESYTETVGWPPAVVGLSDGMGRSGRVSDLLPEQVAAGVRYGQAAHYVDGTQVERHWLWTKPDADYSPEEVRRALERRGRLRLFDPENTVAIRTEGRVNEVAVMEPIDDPGGGEDPPLFTLRATAEEETLHLRHRAGDPVELDRLAVYAGGGESDVGSGTLRPGEAVTVDISDDADDVDVVYRSPAGATGTVASVDAGDGS